MPKILLTNFVCILKIIYYNIWMKFNKIGQCGPRDTYKEFEHAQYDF